MTMEQLKAMAERFAYGIAMVVLMRFVAKGWISGEMAEYLAGGFVMLIGGVIGFIKERPQNLLSRGAAVLPSSAAVVITAAPHADDAVREKLTAIADASSAKVITNA